MIGERGNVLNDAAQYGSLIMRPYNISGNDIDAFYDANDNLVFVLDKTIDESKPNVLLVINPDADKKWDEILSGEYDVDLEYVRPKQDNKYQKLDIEYSGLSVYENLINTYNAGGGIDENLVQLNVLRNSAARHSAVERLNAANEIITRTNVTIVKTKESIVRLEAKLKTLRSKLSDMKKDIGRVAPKQSAAKILKTEAQIDSTKEKLKRAQKRLESAQKRLETATVDAKLASDLLNQPGAEIKQIVKNKPVMVAPKYEMQTVAPVPETEADDVDEDTDEEADVSDDDDNDMLPVPVTETEETESQDNEIKPLFDEDPNIMNNDIAFKPINFDNSDLPVPASESESPAPAFTPTLAVPETDNDNADVDSGYDDSIEDEADDDAVDYEDDDNQALQKSQSVLESLTPVMDEPLVVDDVPSEPVANEEFSREEPWNAVEEQNSEIETVDDTVSEQIGEQSTSQEPIDIKPVPAEEGSRPMSPMIVGGGTSAPVEMVADSGGKSKTKSSFLYYMLLLVLIGLSVFALWMYQKNMGNIKPLLSVGKTDVAVETPVDTVLEPVAPVIDDVEIQPEEPDTVVEDVVQQVPKEENPVVSPQSDVAPIIMGDVSEKVSAFANVPEPEPVVVETVKETVVVEPVVNKPVYGAGTKYNEMFVYEDDVAEDSEYDEDYAEPVVYYPETVPAEYHPESDQFVGYVETGDQVGFVDEYESDQVMYDNNGVIYQDGYADDVFYDDYDPEEAAYQAGDDGYDEYR